MRIQENLKFNINIRSSKPVACHSNTSATMLLILSDKTESNPGPDNECTSYRRQQQSKSFSTTCQVSTKTVQVKADRA